MMTVLEDIKICCPYCGEENWIEVDVSGGEKQSYVEDCQVCCNPIDLKITINGEAHIICDVAMDDEA